MAAKLRPGNVHSADGTLAFTNPETYGNCEAERITYFIRLPNNDNLMRLLAPHLNRPIRRPPKSGIQVEVGNLQYQAQSWHNLGG
jgi:hypothetical protein